MKWGFEMSKTCIRCGQYLGDSEKFCSACGARQPERAGFRENSQPVQTESMHRPLGSYPENSQRFSSSAPTYYHQPQSNVMRPAQVYSQPQSSVYPQPVRKKSKVGLIIGLICGVLAVVVAVVALTQFIGTSTNVKQDSPESLLDSACGILEKSANSKKMFKENELNAVLEYKHGNESAKYMVCGYYNIVASYLTNDASGSKLTAVFGANIQITYSIVNQKTLQLSEYSNYIDPNSGITASDIQEMNLYQLNVTISGSANSQTEMMVLPLAKVDDDWFFVFGQQMDPLGINPSYSSFSGSYPSY